MQGEGVLLAIISLAMGLIGFSSIVTALRRSRDKSWTVQEINGLMLLAIMATGAILFSLLPFSLFYMALSEVEVYSIAAAAYLFFTLAVILGLVVRGRQSGSDWSTWSTSWRSSWAPGRGCRCTRRSRNGRRRV